MDQETDFDLIVIGAGTGGTGVARTAAAAGWKTAIVDELPYGGTCALRGCDPKRMLVAVTEGIEVARNMAANGLHAPEISVNWPEMMAFKRTFTDAMPGRIEGGLDKAGVVTLHGEARFVGPELLDVGGQEHSARYFHIATGARPATLKIPGADLLITSTEFLELDTLPERIVFVGGGFIAMEFAHIASRAGAKKVTVLQRGTRVLENFDPDLVDLLMQASRDLGIKLRCGAQVQAVKLAGSGFEITYETADGESRENCDLVVHAAGRVARIDALNLDVMGIASGPRGIRVDPFMRTTNFTVFAAGDCADSGPNLTPVSANEARIAGKNLIAGSDARAVKYPPIPSVVYTLPPLASVGLSEAAAVAAGLDFEVKFQRTEGWYSSLRVGARHAASKVLVERSSGLILGAHILGPGAEEQINLLAMAMAAGQSANQIKAMIFAYPSFASDLGSMV